MSPLRYCNVAGCTAPQTHHHLDEVPEGPVPCTGGTDDYDRYLSTCCELGPLFEPNPAPHGPQEPCTCAGCWACTGHVLGCTCDIDWDELREAQRAGGVA